MAGLVTTTAAMNESDICEIENPPATFQIFYLVIMGILILCNGLLIIAIALNWRFLRHNIVYTYLMSGLASAVCFCVLSAYEIFHTRLHVDNLTIEGGILQRYNPDIPSHNRAMQIWSFKRGLLVSFFLIMELNVAGLIYAVAVNTHFVGRYSDFPSVKPESKSPHKELNMRNIWQHIAHGRKTKATLLITISWVVPFLLSIPTAVGWNCIHQCECLPAFRGLTTCHSSETDVCSRLWMPTTRSFVFTVTIIYITSIVIMCTMLFITIKKYYKTYSPRKDSEISATNNENGEPIDDELERQNNVARGGESVINPNISDMDSRNELSFPISASGFNKRARPPLHNTIKLLIALTVSVTFSVSPLVLVWFYDILVYKEPQTYGATFEVCITITYLHAASMPFLLLKYMSGLRKVCVDALLRCPCLSTTEIVRRKTRSHAMSKYLSSHNGTKSRKSKVVVPRISIREVDEPSFPKDQSTRNNRIELSTNTAVPEVALSNNNTEM